MKKLIKLGGASIRDAIAIKNLLNIFNIYYEDIIVVISAMGKMTNAFEKLLNKYFRRQDYADELKIIEQYHKQICEDLFNENNNLICKDLDNIFDQLKNVLSQKPALNYNYQYDQIVSYGEIISTTIISKFLIYNDKPNKLIDIRQCLITDSNFREAQINWKISKKMIPQIFNFEATKIYITQGFIGADINNQTTTLGREGSDYSAAIIANILNITQVTIWKDVEGIYNADPHKYNFAQKIDRISYSEAMEMSYSGAKVIHHKTLKPLMYKNIPLIVRSFIHLNNPGTIIHNFQQNIDPQIPVVMENKNQVLITLAHKDYSFIMMENMHEIFANIKTTHLKINMTQNTALNFILCVDNEDDKIKSFLQTTSDDFTSLTLNNISLFTIRHYSNDFLADFGKDKKIIMRQQTAEHVYLIIETQDNI